MALSAAARVVTVGAAPASGPAGDESAAVAAVLGAAGVPVAARAFVDEDEAALESALGGDVGLTVVLAGAGGSTGDVVRRVLARVAGVRLVLNERMLAALEETYRRQDRPLPRRAERLALLPQGAAVWTADGEPGWALDGPRGAVVVLPRTGALPPALERPLVELARARAGTRGAMLTRTLRTAGVGLAELEERLAEWLGGGESRPGDVSVAVLPADGEVWVRLRARGATTEAAAEALAAVESAVAAALGEDCYGRDGESLEQAVGRLLTARGLTLAVAESCTGGLVGHRLTNVPGASAYFERGVVVYSNRAKQELLGVPESVLRAHGAVSAPCAEAMARGVCAAAGSACGLAVTGVAGPDGGTPAKPVGTVFVGVAVGGEVASRRFRFGGDRAAVKWQSAQMALDMLRRRLGGT
ncbi:MAG TPA: nicotinamide-nucleotide amidohydrolase family protein [Methylomirabilota bacterium]|nr:nicotinamide-nucleotide amidohydrolase family protein [Methylomirabilota bacterium]